jgi:hypothetical protein
VFGRMRSDGVSGVSRLRWSAIGAAVAVAVGGGGLVVVRAADAPPSSPGSYVGITPCRVIDTRGGADNVGPRATPIAAGETFTTPFTGAVGNCTIPANVVAVVLNVVVVNPTASSFLTVFPGGSDKPLASNLNWVAGQPPLSNAATVRVGTGGALSFFNLAGDVDVIADVSGYYLPAATGAGPTVNPQVIMSVDPWSMQLSSGAGKGTLNDCVTNATSAGTSGVIPLSIPSGATVTAFAVSAFGTSGFSWQATLVRHRPFGTNGYAPSQVFGTLGGPFGSVTQSEISVGSVVTDQDDAWTINVVLSSTPFSSAICRVRVHYTMP